MAIGTIPLGVAFSSQSFSAAEVASFDQGMAALKASPQWAALLAPYDAGEVIHPWPMIPE